MCVCVCQDIQSYVSLFASSSRFNPFPILSQSHPNLSLVVVALSWPVATKEGSRSWILLKNCWGHGPRAAQRPPLLGGAPAFSADTAATFAGLAFADHLGNPSVPQSH